MTSITSLLMSNILSRINSSLDSNIQEMTSGNIKKTYNNDIASINQNIINDNNQENVVTLVKQKLINATNYLDNILNIDQYIYKNTSLLDNTVSNIQNISSQSLNMLNNIITSQSSSNNIYSNVAQSQLNNSYDINKNDFNQIFLSYFGFSSDSSQVSNISDNEISKFIDYGIDQVVAAITTKQDGYNSNIKYYIYQNKELNLRNIISSQGIKTQFANIFLLNQLSNMKLTDNLTNSVSQKILSNLHSNEQNIDKINANVSIVKSDIEDYNNYILNDVNQNILLYNNMTNANLNDVSSQIQNNQILLQSEYSIFSISSKLNLVEYL